MKWEDVRVFLLLGLLPLTLISIAGCTATAKNNDDRNRDIQRSERIYSAINEGHREAELDLARFARKHANCLAWTDWSQTCSRLSADGQKIHCNDAAQEVQRSDPFCLAIKGAEDPRAVPVDISSADAFGRFCVEFRQFDGSSVCFTRETDRPFAGFHIAELRHPFCEIWGNDDGQYCTEKPNGSGLPTCEEMETAPKASSSLSCFKDDREAKREAQCTGMMSAVTENYPTLIADGVILPTVRRQSNTPTANIYCKTWEAKDVD